MSRTTPKRKAPPKNILEKDTTRFDSPRIITFLDIVFSIPQNMVPMSMSMSPRAGSCQNTEGSMLADRRRTVPISITKRAIFCFFVIFSLRKR